LFHKSNKPAYPAMRAGLCYRYELIFQGRIQFMARPGPETQAKRRREQLKREKRRDKEEKKALRKELKKSGETGVDSIVPPVDETPPADDSPVIIE
jgi:hypothetical protein